MMISRRTFLQSSLLLVPVSQLSLGKGSGYFQHGVASGDPMQDRVIIWTRISDNFYSGEEVIWELSADPHFKHILQKGRSITSAEKDFTVKTDVTGLAAGTKYYYRFRYRNRASITGATQTLPESVAPEGFQMAVVSCNNWEDGYFNSFRFIARKPEVNLVLHLGDYIYEYGTGEYGNPKVDRKNLPSHEIITLTDYRQRYAQYRTDPDLQELHAAKPFVMIWDDHEIANDAYATGAKNHQPNEGDYQTRKNAAMQAYFEWLPVRATRASEMCRSYTVGSDFTLFLTEQRALARTAQMPATDKGFDDRDRGIIGPDQYRWLCNALKEDKTSWKIIGNQVMFAGYAVQEGFKLPKYNDWWLGYPYERHALMNFLQQEKIENTVFLTGDHHESFVLAVHPEQELMKYTRSAAEKPLAWELLTPSITSRNGDRLPEKEMALFEKMLYNKDTNPHLAFADIKSHGYLSVTIKQEQLCATYYYTNNILNREAGEYAAASFKIDKNTFLVDSAFR